MPNAAVYNLPADQIQAVYAGIDKEQKQNIPHPKPPCLAGQGAHRLQKIRVGRKQRTQRRIQAEKRQPGTEHHSTPAAEEKRQKTGERAEPRRVCQVIPIGPKIPQQVRAYAAVAAVLACAPGNGHRVKVIGVGTGQDTAAHRQVEQGCPAAQKQAGQERGAPQHRRSGMPAAAQPVACARYGTGCRGAEQRGGKIRGFPAGSRGEQCPDRQHFGQQCVRAEHRKIAGNQSPRRRR